MPCVLMIILGVVVVMIVW